MKIDWKKITVLLTILMTISGAVVQIMNFKIPNWIRQLDMPDLFELSYSLNIILSFFAYTLTLIGVFKLLRLRKIILINSFKFPIYFFVASNIFWLITSLLSTKYSFFLLPEEAPNYIYIIKVINLVFLISIIGLGLSNFQKNEENNDNHVVSHISRLLNWVVDNIIIFSFGFYIELLSYESIFKDISYLNNNYYWCQPCP